MQSICDIFFIIILFQIREIAMKFQADWGPFLGFCCQSIHSLVRSDLQVGSLHHTCGWVAKSRPLTPLSLVPPAGTFDLF